MEKSLGGKCQLRMGLLWESLEHCKMLWQEKQRERLKIQERDNNSLVGWDPQGGRRCVQSIGGMI